MRYVAQMLSENLEKDALFFADKAITQALRRQSHFDVQAQLRKLISFMWVNSPMNGLADCDCDEKTYPGS